MKFKLAMLCMVLSLSAVILTPQVQAQRIKDIANVQGVRSNQLIVLQTISCYPALLPIPLLAMVVILIRKNKPS